MTRTVLLPPLPVIAVALQLLGAPALVAADPPLAARLAAEESASCLEGLFYDDQSLEDGVSPTGSSNFGAAVMRFDPPPGVKLLRQMCVCWLGLSGSPSTIEYDLVVFTDDGPGGEPGDEWARIPVVASGIGTQTMFFSHDVESLGLELPEGSFYAGVSTDWGSSEAFLCTDEDGPGTQPSFLTNDGGSTWNPFATSALGIRTDFSVLAQCDSTATRLCIDAEPGDSRFSVELSFASSLGGGVSGEALATPLSSLGIAKGGIFSFSDPANPEILVKVLNGCAITGHFWVFFAATTTLGFELTVTDTVAGVTRTYVNPDQTAAQTVTDTQAFATCPST